MASSLDVQPGPAGDDYCASGAGCHDAQTASSKVAGVFATHTEVDQLLAIASSAEVAELAAMPGAQDKGLPGADQRPV